jgi:hypothetical protein
MKRSADSDTTATTKEHFIMTRSIIQTALCILLALAAAAASAQSQTYTLDLPVTSQVTSNSCTAGEPVTLNGTLHLAYSFTTDADGVNHFSFNATNDLSGVGQASGAGYTVAGSSAYTVNTSDASAELYPDVRSDLVPRSSGVPLTLVQSLQLSADSSGTITAQILQQATQCAN